MTVLIFPARPVHVRPIAMRMREADAEECHAHGLRPHDALDLSFRASVLAWTAVVDGVPEVMIGVSCGDMLTGIGVPWMLGTDDGFRRRKAVLENGPWIVDAMHARFPRLENWVAERNAGAMRLLRRLGFHIDEDARDVGGLRFRRFWRTMDVH